MLTPEHLAECLAHLAKKGVTVRLNGDALEIRDLKAEKRRAFYRARYQRRKAAKQGGKPGVNRGQTGGKPGANEIWRGITWRDVPGRDEAARKMRFSLLKRGDWTGYKSCQYLEGDALKAAFAKITEGQKAKSQKAATMRTEAAQKRNESEQP